MMLLDIQKKGKESYINNIKTSIWFKCINIKPKPNLFSSNMFMISIFILKFLIHPDYFDDGIHLESS